MAAIAGLQSQIDRLAANNLALNQRLQDVERGYSATVNEMVRFQKNLVDQDVLVRSMVNMCMRVEDGFEDVNESQ